MSITFDAVYEGGQLRPEQPLPLAERQRVRVTIESQESSVDKTAGMMGFAGSADEATRWATSAELDPQVAQ